MGASGEGVLTSGVDPGGGAGRVIDVVRMSFGGKTPFPVGGEVRILLRDGGHGLSGRIWKWKGMGQWQSRGGEQTGFRNGGSVWWWAGTRRW